MTSVCICLQAHQPYRLRSLTYFDIGGEQDFDDEKNTRNALAQTAEDCYLPLNNLLWDLIKESNGRLRWAFSVTGILLEQMERYSPDVLESFKRLADTGCVEFLGGTYYYSNAGLFSRREFREQVQKQANKVKELFGQKPRTFCQRGLIYTKEIAQHVEKLGYAALLADGGERRPHFFYRPAGCTRLKLLLNDRRMADGIATGFSQLPGGVPSIDRLAPLIEQIGSDAEVVNLFLNCETLCAGQQRLEDAAEFLRALLQDLGKRQNMHFETPAAAARHCRPSVEWEAPDVAVQGPEETAPADWSGNDMQKDALRTLYDCEGYVRQAKDNDLLHTWRKLQTTDHFLYMCTRESTDMNRQNGIPYESPYDAYINFMNALEDFRRRQINGGKTKRLSL